MPHKISQLCCFSHFLRCQRSEILITITHTSLPIWCHIETPPYICLVPVFQTASPIGVGHQIWFVYSDRRIQINLIDLNRWRRAWWPDGVCHVRDLGSCPFLEYKRQSSCRVVQWIYRPQTDRLYITIQALKRPIETNCWTGTGHESWVMSHGLSMAS
jgi:hypothetical protein